MIKPTIILVLSLLDGYKQVSQTDFPDYKQ